MFFVVFVRGRPRPAAHCPLWTRGDVLPSLLLQLYLNCSKNMRFRYRIAIFVSETGKIIVFQIQLVKNETSLNYPQKVSIFPKHEILRVLRSYN